MATESPMRMVETTGAKKWHSSKDTSTFGSAPKDMAAEELGLLTEGEIPHKDQTEMIPSRSGSAPPSMEGSFAAIGNLLAQQNISIDSSLENLQIAIENSESEEQLLSDPAYIAYYCANVNLNPRLPPPLISRENQRLVRHIGAYGNNRKFTSVDGSGNKLQLSRGMLSTHKEEPENNRSSGHASDSRAESSIPVKNTSSLAARHKSLVDLIQEDFPRTPSPVYSLSRSSIHATEEPADCDLSAVSLKISSVNIAKQPECNRSSIDIHEDAPTLDSNSFGLTSTNDPLATSSDEIGKSPVLQRDKSSSKLDTSTGGSSGLLAPKLDSRMRALNDNNNRNKQEKKPYERNLPPRQSVMQRGGPYHGHGGHTQVISQGVNYPNNDLNKPFHGYPKFFPEGQPALPSPGMAPPLYATTAAYMASGSAFYPFQPFAHLYGLGGYAPSSTFIPQLMPGFPSHGSIPLAFDANSVPSVSTRSNCVSAGESIPHLSDLQNISHFFGQQGLMLQPPLMDPVHMQYFHHPYEEAYTSSQYGRIVSSSGIVGQKDSFAAQKESVVASYIGDQKFQSPTNGTLATPNSRNVGIPGGSFYASPSSMGFMTQFPASPLASPVLPVSPVGGTGHPGWRNDLRFPMSPGRSSEGHSVWQGQRGASSDDLKRNSFLEELKSSSAQNFQLSDIVGRIVEFSADQHGSRFIQQKLESCSLEEKESVFREVLPHSLKLMTDVFGNYVIQKFFEHGSPELRKELANQLSGQMLHLSLQMYGCRVIQKALEVIELDQKIQLVNELDGHVIRCVRDQNGNHVIQKCIECVPADRIGFIISSFRGQVATLSTHPYGCRVIQRVLEHCSDEQQSQSIVDEILESSYDLAQDQYGNYVTQHVLERGKPHERNQIIDKLSGKIVQMSQHKYASNVVEKCLVYGDASERQLIINEIIGKQDENDHLLAMMKDQFANYVVQKILEICSGEEREILLNCVKVHLNALKKYTYGKHIVARYEQLSGEDSQDLET